MRQNRFAGLWAIVLTSTLWAQQSVPINFIATGTACENDFNKDGRDDFWTHFFEGGVTGDHIQTSLDNSIRFAGVASQCVRLQRSSGVSGRFVLYEGVNFNAPIKPAIGEALLVKVAIRAEGFRNATYQVYVSTGSRRIDMLPETSQDTGGWQQISTVAPVEADQNGAPQFSLRIGVKVLEGAASGTLWIDEAYILTSRTVSRADSLPNGLKLCYNFLYPEKNPYAYLNLPFNIVVGVAEVGQALQRHYPNTIWMPYCYFSGTLHPNTYRHNADLYNYDDVVQNHPDWFLLDQNGQRIPLDDSFYVDIGRPEVRERAWQSLRDFLNRCGRPRYVYLDNVDLRVGPNRFNPPNYPTNEAWVNAVVGWFEYVGSRVVQEFRTTFVPNAAWGPGFWLRGIPGVSQDAPGVANLPYIGGFMIEHAFTHARSTPGQTTISIYGTATGSNGPQYWKNWVLRNTIRLATEHPDKIIILIPSFWLGYPDSQKNVRFAVAMCLIVQHENTYIHLDPRRQQADYPTGYFPPELFIPLGNPVGNFRIQDGDIIVGGLFIREYQNGIVLANPRSDRDFTFVVPRDLYDWDRNLIRAGTQITIPRQTGLVLWSAPEISVSLSPSNVEVLPGETVQFTVTYRNTGTAPGTNVRIAVPLPDGMTLVGSNPTATLENGQVVWVVPNIPVNGTGTLRFTVRVQ